MNQERQKTDAIADAVEIERIKKKIIELQHGGDIESAHSEADDLLCELLILLGHGDIVDEYEMIDKWYA